MPIVSGGEPAFTKWDETVPIIKEGSHTDVYLTEVIAAPWEYSKLCHGLGNAQDNDTYTFHINNVGGSLDSGFMIIDAINNSKATITAKLSGTVASVSTIITLACDKIIVADHTAMLVHKYFIEIPDDEEIATAEELELAAKLPILDIAFKKIYTGFLSNKEIRKVLNQHTIWMDKDTILQRWDKLK